MYHKSIAKIMYKARNVKYAGFLWHSLIILFAAMLIHGCYYDNEEDLYPMTSGSDCDTTNVTYAETVAPILNQNCVCCHNQNNPTANVIVDNHADLITVVNNESFWGAINHDPNYAAMPQGGAKLPDCDLNKIKTWIDMGAPNN